MEFLTDHKSPITIEELIGGNQENQELMALNAKPTEVPLHQDEQQKIDRVVAYRKVKKDMHKWQPLVNHNNRSKTLELPFQKEKTI